MANKNRFDFENYGDDAVIYIYGEVGDEYDGITSSQFAAELASLGKVKNIDVRINSKGGDVFDGFAIFNALLEHPAKISVIVDGLAASIASVIAMAGDTIEMAKNSYMMIHNAHSGVLLLGDADALDAGVVNVQKRAGLLRKMNSTIAEHYSERTGMELDKILGLMRDETWMQAKDAVASRFADAIGTGMSIAACLQPSQFGFKNVPGELLAAAISGDAAPVANEVPTIESLEKRIQEKLLQGREQNAA